MIEVMSVNGAREIDRSTINYIGMPSIVLMENAAHSIYDNIVHKADKFLIVCCQGNNGADGLVIARKLLLSEKEVFVMIIGGKNKTEEFEINFNILSKITDNILIINNKLDINSSVIELIKRSDIVIDSIFGIGINRNVTGLHKDIIESINNNAKYVIAVDSPSGVNCDSGEIQGVAIKANETYTFEVYKKGFLNYNIRDYLGEVKVTSIGIPEKIKASKSEGVYFLDKKEYKSFIPIRKSWGYKGDYGRVLILAGSKEYTGAAFITAESAVRSGAGLVTIVVEDDIYDILAGKLIEAMVVKYSDGDRIDELIKKADTIVAGPGIGKGSLNIRMLRNFILNSSCPVVLDADGLNALNDNNDLLKKLEGRAIFTPHPGEMERLSGLKVNEIEKNRIDICRNYSKNNNVITLLKGYNTVISDGYKVIINNSGSSKMASGGMGDCLSGVIGSLLSQGIELFNAAVLGAYIHGLAAERIGVNRYSVNARDVIEEIPKILEYILSN